MVQLKLSKANAYKVHTWINNKLFKGELSLPEIKVYDKLWLKEGNKKAPLLGAYNGASNELLLSKSHGDFVWQETLYHEMCHQADWELLLTDDLRHGASFKELYEECLGV